MLTVGHVEVAGWAAAFGGMRNALDSWRFADSGFLRVEDLDETAPYALSTMGPNDKHLIQRLLRPGTPDHCKFRRMLVVYCNITAPLYWWKQFDTYKVGTVCNSCSTMHTLADKEFELKDFSHDQLLPGGVEVLSGLIDTLNNYRRQYLEARDYAREYEEKGTEPLAEDHRAKAKSWWYGMVQLLPSSYNQFRTVQLNYEVLANIYRGRKNHKLQEWHDFISAMVTRLPEPWIFTGETND